MGFFSIAIGLVDLGAVVGRPAAASLVVVANRVVPVAVIPIGVLCLGSLQVVGGTIGLFLFLPTVLGLAGRP